MSNIHAKCSFGSKTLFDTDFDAKAGKTSQNVRDAQAQIMTLINKHMDLSCTVGEDGEQLVDTRCSELRGGACCWCPSPAAASI